MIRRMRHLLPDPPASEERLPRFDTPNVLWFFGAIATATATNALIAAVHPSARGVWILLVSLGFSSIYTGLSAALRASHWWVPGGLFATIVVSLVPAVGVASIGSSASSLRTRPTPRSIRSRTSRARSSPSV
jgi:uncharacterized membrane protein